jgi:hypothetical protein
LLNHSSNKSFFNEKIPEKIFGVFLKKNWGEKNSGDFQKYADN